ncbi:A/G-specific adenine glycosylase [Taibaiella sp. KBW10]|nr:A/G-specific adenine glycosylase [Taibaiella sp. KBW10]
MAVSVFAQSLLQWHSESNSRILPWKEEKDPYKIWLSEIILQQTRAEQGLPYYVKFISKYPTVFDLAAAPEGEVFKLWQGLGYYARCRNLLFTARAIVAQWQGVFPQTYTELLTLKGVGEYTAAAIASFAYDLPHPVIDGNVYRVLSRYFAEPTPINTPEGKKVFTALANKVFDAQHPAAYNQAIMDLGAVVCKPKQALCNLCYLSDHCKAFNTDQVDQYPLKLQKIKVKERFFSYYVFLHKDQVYIQQRTHKDVWQDLYEFWLSEGPAPAALSSLLADEQFVLEYRQNIFHYKQRLTHQLIRSDFSLVRLKRIPALLKGPGIWINKSEIHDYSFPKTIVSFLEEIPYF